MDMSPYKWKILKFAVIWLKYCRYGLKRLHNQSINKMWWMTDKPTISKHNFSRMNLSTLFAMVGLIWHVFSQYDGNYDINLIHLFCWYRFLYGLIKTIVTGLQARLEVNKMTEEEQKALTKKHQERIDFLTEECKKVWFILI